jgi:hypothetical protein
MAKVLPDGKTLEMVVFPKRLQGVNAKSDIRTIPNVGDVLMPIAPVPMPEFRLSLEITKANVYDGQTLVIQWSKYVEELQTNMVTKQITVRGKPAKTHVIFVTPTLVDPDGNALHPDTHWNEVPNQKPSLPFDQKPFLRSI